MYERSAIVLERYMEKILKLNKQYNLKKNNENYSELISEIENYQSVTEKELEVIQEFDDTAKEIENLQQEQEKLYKANKNLEEERAQLFTELGEEAEVLDVKLKNIEELIEKNNQKLKEVRTEFVKNLTDFSKKQKNRNKCEKARRIGEANHIAYIKRMHTEFEELDVKDIVSLKDFINFEKEQVRQEALQIMIRNGKSERVPFNQEVLKRAIKVRIEIAEKEAECYISVYDKMKKLLAEQDTETIRLNKYKKTLRDTSVKLAFLNAQREYIVGFLDYERMTAISGEKVHNKMMMEACNNFELDIMQIDKLYELIMRETNNRSTKKGYNQLYNKTYLKNIEDKEKNFEQEVNNVNISMGTVINSNYWRIEGIKNIYNVFQEEVSKKFNRDLSEYRIEEIEKTEEIMAVSRYKTNNESKKEKEERYKQFKYDEYGKYDEYDYEEDDEDQYEDKYEDNYEEEDEERDIEEYQYKIDDYNFNNQENDKDRKNYDQSYEEDYNDYKDNYEEEYNDYEDNYEEDDDDYDDDNYNDEYEDNYDDEYEEDEIEDKEEIYNEEIYEEDDFDEEEEEETYQSYRQKNAFSYKPRAYLEEDEDEFDDYESNYQEKDNYEENDEEDYEEDYEEENNNYRKEEAYEEEKDNYRRDDYEDDYNDSYYDDDEEDDYQAYNNKSSYLEEDEEDDEYENIYEYNYDDDEEEYRKQKLKNKTVISFDDEESIDMIIANSRKKSTNRKNNAKGLFNKLFKK